MHQDGLSARPVSPLWWREYRSFLLSSRHESLLSTSIPVLSKHQSIVNFAAEMRGKSFGGGENQVCAPPIGNWPSSRPLNLFCHF
jgi:hypothetical protein